MQKSMYRFCDVNYIDFWEYTPAESDAMLKIAQDKFEYDITERAILLMWIANAPHASKKNDQLFEINDFLPDFLKHEPTYEEIAAAWLNAAK